MLKYILYLNFIFTGCDQNFTAPFGKISSPNFPSHPPRNILSCLYRISAPAGQRVQINILSNPNLTRTAGCYYGSIKIFEADNPDLGQDTPSAQFCGEIYILHKAYLSKRNSLLVAYTKKASSEYFRFQLEYRFVKGKYQF